MTHTGKQILEVEIAPFQMRDIAAVAEVATESYATQFGPIMHSDYLEHVLATTRSVEFFEKAAPAKTILVAKAAGQVAGYAMFGEASIPEVLDHGGFCPDDRELSRLYVSTRMHGMGIGRRLLDESLNHPELASAPNVFLQVWEENPAQRLYEKFGFIVSDEIGPTTYECGYKTAAVDLVMVRPSSPYSRSTNLK